MNYGNPELAATYAVILSNTGKLRSQLLGLLSPDGARLMDELLTHQGWGIAIEMSIHCDGGEHPLGPLSLIACEPGQSGGRYRICTLDADGRFVELPANPEAWKLAAQERFQKRLEEYQAGLAERKALKEKHLQTMREERAKLTKE